MKRVILLVLLFGGIFIGTSQGLNVAISGTSQTGNQAIIDFFV